MSVHGRPRAGASLKLRVPSLYVARRRAASSAAPRVLSRGSLPPKTVARRAAPYTEWIGACQGGTAANCNFDCASLIAETALPGVVAERVAGRHLEWHPAAMRLPNSPEARALVNPPARAGWTIE